MDIDIIKPVLGLFGGFWIIVSGIYLLPQIIEETTNKIFEFLLPLSIFCLAILIIFLSIQDLISKRSYNGKR
jgi:succinate-acetate transporter protein